MKVSIIATVAAAATAQASIIRRDATTIAGLLEGVFQAMTNVDNHLLNFQNDPASLHPAGVALLDTLKSGTQTAEAMQPLTLEDVVSIADVSYRVSSIGSQFLADFEAAAPVFAAWGICDLAYNYSLTLEAVSNQFFRANKDKFPPESQAMAIQQIYNTNAEFARTQTALTPGACVNQIERDQPASGPVHPSLPDEEPSPTTSIAYHTGTSVPATPTCPPNQPADGQPGAGHNNGTHSGQPPKPVIGSAMILGSPLNLAMLPVAVAVYV
ncbi:hypothetical protein F4801DRAFT_536169, partial [Xylaria longipes]